MYIYIWSRPAAVNPRPPMLSPPKPPSNHGAERPSTTIRHGGLVSPMHYIAGYLYAVFAGAFNMPVHTPTFIVTIN